MNLRFVCAAVLACLMAAAGPVGSGPSWTVEGAASGDRLGGALATGDVNGDQVSDLIVSGKEPHATLLGEKTEHVYVYLGHEGGPSLVPDWSLVGENIGDGFGSAVATGDVNGDAIADIVVGAPGASAGLGRVYVYFGHDTDSFALFPGDPDWQADGVPDLSGYDTGGGFGLAVTAADVNGDLKADVFVGAPNWYQEPSWGRVFGFETSEPGLPVSPTWSVTASDLIDANNRVPMYLGQAISCVGDVDGNGNGDLLVGAPLYSDVNMPGAFLFLGGASGLAMQPAWTGYPGVSGTLGSYGTSVAGAGDLDEDGKADFLVGAPDSDDQSGRVYVYYGQAADPDGRIFLNPPTVLQRPGGDRFGSFVCGVGDVNGNGYADIVVADRSGAAQVFNGGTGGLSLHSALTFDHGGLTVVAAGNVNGDGYPDLILGDPAQDRYVDGILDAVQAGSARVYYGGEDPLPAATMAPQDRSQDGCLHAAPGSVAGWIWLPFLALAWCGCWRRIR